MRSTPKEICVAGEIAWNESEKVEIWFKFKEFFFLKKEEEKLDEIQFRMNAQVIFIDRNFNFSTCYCMYCSTHSLHSFAPFILGSMISYRIFRGGRYMDFINVWVRRVCLSSHRQILPSTENRLHIWWNVAWMQNNHCGSSSCMCDIGCSLRNSGITCRQVNKISVQYSTILTHCQQLTWYAFL